MNRKQSVCINNMLSEFNKVVSGVPQGSIVGPILFNCFFNEFYYFIKNANVHNFADDNTLTTFGQNVGTLISVLESENKIAIDWFETNKMIVNPGKFQSIIIDKKKQYHTKETFEIGDKVIEASPSVKLCGVQIDDKLNFNLHITNICRPAANQLNALIRFNQFLSFEAKKVLVNSYFYSSFNYCPLVWMFSSAKSLNKIESLQKRALRYLYSDYQLPYDILLAKSGKVTMKASRLRSLCAEIYKSINPINPSFMNEIFRLRVTNRVVRSQYRLNLDIPKFNRVSFVNNSIRSFGPKIWNSLPPHIKSCENLETFKRVIENWDGVTCNCRVCKN